MINVIIYRFSLVDKASIKRRKFKYSGNEYQMMDLEQKSELQKCNETLTILAVTVMVSMFRFG